MLLQKLIDVCKCLSDNVVHVIIAIFRKPPSENNVVLP